MKINIFQKYFFLALICLLGFILLGVFFNSFLMRQLAPKPVEFSMPPPLLFAKLVDRLNPTDKVAALKEISQMSDSFPALRLTLISDAGVVIYPPEKKLSFEWSQIQKPVTDYGYIAIETTRPGDGLPPPPLLGPLNFGPPPGGPGRGGVHRETFNKAIWSN